MDMTRVELLTHMSTKEEEVLRLLRRVSWVVVGGYGIALCYRFGLFRKIFSKRTVNIIENVVEKIKSKTEPLGDSRRYATARYHLIYVYLLSSLGIFFATIGGTVFFVFPKIPISIPMAFTLIPSIFIFLLPRDMMIHIGRVLSLFIICFAFGYSFGPIGWVAWDSIGIAMILLGSTMIGLCVPLFLTRGMISYVLSSQLLSCSLSLAAVTTIPLITMRTRSRGGGRGDSFVLSSAHVDSGFNVLYRADVNVLVTLQLLSNCGINLLHTLPTIVRFVQWKGSEEALLRSVDPLKESLCICAGMAYVLWRSFRWACRRLLLTLTKEEMEGTSKELYQKEGHFLNKFLRPQHVSSVGASLLLVVWYVRAVSSLQRGETVATLEALRCVCARVSPINLLIKGS